MMPHWLDSPGWTALVKALLHTLWQGAVIAGLLAAVLRRLAHPGARYRWALAALGAVFVSGLMTWGVLSVPAPRASSPASVSSVAPAVPATAAGSGLPTLVVNSPPLPATETPAARWTAWLALLWVAGASLMLARASWQVAGAERLRRSSRPLDDPRLAALLAEARQAVGVARRVRLAVTEKLTSPVVTGVLVPTLILPLSLTTTLTAEQIRFVLLHELAHIRRGDYFANLFQLFAEALLFFNPAVWWISRQLRLEREACCDLLAVELSGAPADYARTLVCVVENVLSPAPAAAPALGDRREPSSLADRLQRMLVPGYRPALRLTWRAMLAALVVGGTLLFLSALGTRVTIAAILTPQERIERIGQKMAEYGQAPAVPGATNDDRAPQVRVAGHLRMADGSPVPEWVMMEVLSASARGSSAYATSARNGKFSQSVARGTIHVGAELTNFAPVVTGPLDGFVTNDFEDLELVFTPGFSVPLRVEDADTGAALTNATIATLYWMSTQGFRLHARLAAADGSFVLDHCADLPLDITVNAPGYGITQKHFDHVRAGETLEVGLHRGKLVAGMVLDQVSGRPVAGAAIHLLYQTSAENPGRFNWDDPLHLLGQTDGQGAFMLGQLPSGLLYYLGISAAGHESVILERVSPGTEGLMVRLGPELIVRGHVTGKLDGLQQVDGQPALDLTSSEVYEQNSFGEHRWVPLVVSNGVASFVFTNRIAGQVTLGGSGALVERDLTAPIDDWVVNLETALVAAKPGPKREVIFRFKHPSGVPPRGTVAVTIPDSLDIDHLTAHEQEMEITNGEVRVPIPIGGQTEIEPKFLPGYWFSQWNIGGPGLMMVTVTNGAGPMVIEIPLVDAGAIYATARNADGTPAGGLLFGVNELKRAPGRDANSPLSSDSDGFTDPAPRKWVSGPLPLGGTYQVHGWRGNAFCLSAPWKLTGASPDTAVELRFAAGKTFHGIVLDAGGQPLRDTEIEISFALPDQGGFQLKPVLTDGQGCFELPDATPDVGVYAATVTVPGLRAESVPLNFAAQPQTIRLQPGRILGGRVVEAGTGRALAGVEIRAWQTGSLLPQQRTRAGADGRFLFNTLHDGDYTLFVEEGAPDLDQKYPANGKTNWTVAVKLYPWSKLKPKAAVTSPGTTNSSRVRTGNIPAMSTARPATAAYRPPGENPERRSQNSERGAASPADDSLFALNMLSAEMAGASGTTTADDLSGQAAIRKSLLEAGITVLVGPAVRLETLPVGDFPDAPPVPVSGDNGGIGGRPWERRP